MKKSFFKVFFSKIKETQWLNKLGEEGYLLEKISDSKYHFTQNTDAKYKYSIEYLNCPLKSAEADKYFLQRKEQGINPIITSGNWVYFVTEKDDFALTTEVYKKCATPYFWRTLYLFFFALVGAVLSGYQFFAIDFLKRSGYTSTGLIEKLSLGSTNSPFDNVLEAIMTPFNFVIDLINDSYIRVLTDAFGKSDAVIILAFLIPIVILLFVLGAFNLDEYTNYRKLIKNTMPSNMPAQSQEDLIKEDEDAEQAI